MKQKSIQTDNAYRFRAYPSEEQTKFIRNSIGASRFVWNTFLSLRYQIIRKMKAWGWKWTKSKLEGLLKKILTELKQKQALTKWLNEADSMALQASLEDLERAFENWHARRTKKPRFKSKRKSRHTYRTKSQFQKKKRSKKYRKRQGSIKFDGSRLKLPKIGWLKIRVPRKIKGRILNVTVEETPSGEFFVSICVTDQQFDFLPKTGKKVGVDLGIKNLAILSDGKKFENPKYLRKNQKKLAHLQRLQSRKPKGSKQYQKLRIKIARLHEKIKNQRRDHQHKLTHYLVTHYDIICVESLAVKNMMKSHRLARAIADAGWGEIVRQLEYKCERYGRTLIKVGRFYPSSQTCSSCGFKNPSVRDLSVRKWVCPVCGMEHDRDGNAAMNILREGLRLKGV